MTVGKHDRLRIRATHPGLYHSILTLSLMSVALAVNFWTSTPTFNPYGIDKNYVGVVFFILGGSQFLVLNVFQNLRMVRLILTASLVFILFWGVSNTQQFFAGNASLQLPILYLTIAALHIPFLVESPVNPMTQRQDEP